MELDESPEIVRNLNEEKRNILEHFQEIAGQLDASECIKVLDDHNWDLSASVEYFMGLPPSTMNRSSTSTVSDSTHENADVRQRILHSTSSSSSQPSLPVPRVHVDFGDLRIVRNNADTSAWRQVQDLILAPFYIFYYIFRDILKFLEFLFWSRRTPVTDPREDVCQFIDDFQTKYCSNGSASSSASNPPFLRDAYSEALRYAKNELKPLVVYLHNPAEPAADDFCRLILCSQAFIEYARSNVVLWGCDVNSYEGQRVSRALRDPPQPSIVIVILKTPINGGTPRMTLVGRIQGVNLEAAVQHGANLYATQQVSSLVNIISDHEATLVTARLDREERQLAQRLRQEQDREYEESLKVDEERMRAKASAAANIQAVSEEKSRREDILQQAKCLVASSMPESYKCYNTCFAEQSHNLVRILLRLPSGKKMEFCFPKNISSKALYLAVFSLPNAPSNFELCTNFPKKVIDCSVKALRQPLDSTINIEDTNFWSPQPDDPPSFADLQFAKSETILVIDLDA